MAKYRDELPQLKDRLFITDGGLETTLIFHDGLELNHFAAFELLKNEAGYAHLSKYFLKYVSLASEHDMGFVLESATWRASPDWSAKLGITREELARLNHRAIALLHEIRDKFETKQTPIVISGNIGPRGDGYQANNIMTPEEAANYHAWQIGILDDAEVDMISAFTIPTVEEAIGITTAAQDRNIPAIISFTVETDGRLPSGQPLQQAIKAVDTATSNGPVYYMINCAHPSHFEHAINGKDSWLLRIRGIRANASCKSHAELDESETLDDGNPEELGKQYRKLQTLLPNLSVMGGCCGTDHRHVEAICSACAAG